MNMKNIATIRIGTEKLLYTITIPNITHEEVINLIRDAAEAGKKANYHSFYMFVFNNEELTISERPLFVHHFIKEDNYLFNTPDVRVTSR
jgi:hypothetical protein